MDKIDVSEKSFLQIESQPSSKNYMKAKYVGSVSGTEVKFSV